MIVALSIFTEMPSGPEDLSHQVQQLNQKLLLYTCILVGREWGQGLKAKELEQEHLC